MHQIDINNVFFNGDLHKKLHMSQPQGLIDETRSHFVCKLKKALYKLKQTSMSGGIHTICISDMLNFFI